MDYRLLIVILSAIASFIAVHWFYFRILKIAKIKNLVDNPDARKLQKEPVPVMGGIAVFIGTVAGVMVGLALGRVWDIATGFFMQLPIFSAMVAMLYVGAIDDIIGLSPRSRLAIEVIAMLCLIYGGGLCINDFHGIWGINQFSWSIGVPLTIFIGVGIINAINMVDGVNGLSSGLCITCSILFGFVFVKCGDLPSAVLAFAMAAALLPFFMHNVFGRRSRMFIGDAGTMVLGILMVWFVINTLSGSHVEDYFAITTINRIAMVLAILSVPVFDTLRVMTQRILNGNSPFEADKTHLHHAYIRIGMSHSLTTLCEILLDLFVVFIWWLSARAELSFDIQLYIVIASSILLIWGTYAVLTYLARHHTPFVAWLTGRTQHREEEQNALMRKMEFWLDKPEKEVEEVASTHGVPTTTVEKFALEDK